MVGGCERPNIPCVGARAWHPWGREGVHGGGSLVGNLTLHSGFKR